MPQNLSRTAESLLKQARRLLSLVSELPNANEGDGLAAPAPPVSGAAMLWQSPEGHGIDDLATRDSADVSGCAPPFRRGVGERLYLLDYQRLCDWAVSHWDSIVVMEEVCDAFRHNWTTWRREYPKDWRGPDMFFKWEEHLAGLCESAEEDAEEDEPDEQRHAETDEMLGAAASVVGYAESMQSAICNWDYEEELRRAADALSQICSRGNASWTSEWRPHAVLERIQRRLHELLWATAKRESSPIGMPKWPDEAAHPAAVALAAERFFHSTGMLRFMGYRVGKASGLTPDRRRAVLAYVLKGKLPKVNDRHYMQEWGSPNTGRRLRKLANSLAAFARNAKRKKSKSWQKSICDWEADLAYLKKRYYDRRSRDWKWPETGHRRKG